MDTSKDSIKSDCKFDKDAFSSSIHEFGNIVFQICSSQKCSETLNKTHKDIITQCKDEPENPPDNLNFPADIDFSQLNECKPKDKDGSVSIFNLVLLH